MTDGLKRIAGGAIRNALMRFTRSPLSGATTGAACTAILQSSSATTVAAVGFVGAGLLSFPSALGIIFGANIGTTITGWMVALLGFKLQLGLMVLPLIFAGAIMRLFGEGRIASSGYALAGFGLIFVGITMLQQGMGDLHGVVSFEQFSGDSIGGRLLLVLFGIIFTLITQSSSAGVAAALTALFSGFISFEQAAALVIGMDIGTTVTAALATVGGSTGARRTGFSHVIYNFFTGLGAFLLITPYTLFWESISPGALIANAEIALVAFHTSFNLLGVMMVLPFARQFAHFIERIIPAKLPQSLDLLDRSLLRDPPSALNAAQAAIEIDLKQLLHHVSKLLDRRLSTVDDEGESGVREMQQSLDQSHDYLDQIHLKREDSREWPRLVALIHTLDHMQRLHERCDEEVERAVTARSAASLKPQCTLLVNALSNIEAAMVDNQWLSAAQQAAEVADKIDAQRSEARAQVMESIGSGEISVSDGTAHLEAIRWLRRVSHHIARITHHMTAAYIEAGS